MSVGVTSALVIGGLGAAGAIGGAAIGAHAAGSARDAQVQAARDAMARLDPLHQASLDRLQRYADAGQGGLDQIRAHMNFDDPSLSDPSLNHLNFNDPTQSTPYSQVDPTTGRAYTAADLTMDPGYQFRLNEGLRAVQNSAAGRGLLNSGATLRGITQYGQGFASNEFQNAFNRYQTDRNNRYSMFQGDRNNRFNIDQGLFDRMQTDRNNRFNIDQGNFGRGLAVAGLGAGAAGGQNAADSEYGRQITDLTTGIGNANAAAATARGNAFSNALTGSTNSLQQLLLLSQMGGGGGNSYGTGYRFGTGRVSGGSLPFGEGLYQQVTPEALSHATPTPYYNPAWDNGGGDTQF